MSDQRNHPLRLHSGFSLKKRKNRASIPGTESMRGYFNDGGKPYGTETFRTAHCHTRGRNPSVGGRGTSSSASETAAVTLQQPRGGCRPLRD
jgi:hypothetical protein